MLLRANTYDIRPQYLCKWNSKPTVLEMALCLSKTKPAGITPAGCLLLCC